MLKFIITYLKYKYLLYVFALLAGWPCVFYLMGWLPDYTVNYVILFVLAGATALIKNAYRHVPKPIAIIISIQIFCWFFYTVFYQDSSYLTRVFLLFITLSILGIQLSYRDKYEFINTYNFWLVFQAVAGSIGFVLVFSGLLKPLSQFIEMDGRPGYFYGLFTTNAVFEGFIRNAGFYDEPGALACWGIFALLLNKLFIDNKKIEYLLIFGLISTLSMAYFVQLILYFFYFYKKQWKKLVLPVISFLILLISMASLDEGIDYAIFGRFASNEQTGGLTGDNRTQLLLKTLNVFKTSPIFGVGATNLSTKYADDDSFLGANFFVNWAADGILGSLVTYLPFFLLFKLGKYKRQYKYAFLIIILGFIQRPYTDTILLYPLISYTLVLYAYLDIRKYKKASNSIIPIQ